VTFLKPIMLSRNDGEFLDRSGLNLVVEPGGGVSPSKLSGL
jgi:hypothetical protein